MIEFTDHDLYAWINAFIWPFFRVAGLMATAPLLSESTITPQLKAGFAVVLTLVIAPTLGAMPEIPTGSWEALLIVIQQILIGVSLGFVMRLVFAIVLVAGEFIGFQMGLSFASFFDPSAGASTAVISRLLNLVMMLLFLAVDGHLVMIHAFVYSFELFPIGVGNLSVEGWGVIMEASRDLFLSGLLLALPLVIVLLTMNLAFGILNRTAQQITIFAVGFPITLSTGLILLIIVVPQMTPFMTSILETGYENMARLMQGFATKQQANN